jgi:hypothetical protein
MNIVFYHSGTADELVEIFTESVKISNPNSILIQISDQTTPPVKYIDKIIRFAPDERGILLARVFAFSNFESNSPTWFLDTDMIVKERLPILERSAICRRQLGKDHIFNHSFCGNDFSEYRNMELDEVYPILACASYSFGENIWKRISEYSKFVNSKFFNWFYDQELLRHFYFNETNYTLLFESEYACLPEYPQYFSAAKILHFKGRARKSTMREIWQ